ncbi:MAG: ParB/RepB/Spo0J family partition protein [Aquabacterium sp.]|nr:ParB/RepB/Spo0J family partition protein [Aquabacterium sp.]
MAKKLLEKAGLIHLPPAPARTPLPDGVVGSDADAAKAKTAPGSMLQFMTAQSAAVKEAEALRERLAGFEGALPTRRLDPATVRVSVWANRHDDSYQDAGFLALKADIAAAGGNVQPIKVRPVLAAGVAPTGGGLARTALVEGGVGRSNPPAALEQFEIVFGHRRHRACLELGLPVLALVENLAEQQLFVEMERENRSRKDLSAWEQGMMYARALDQGLYPSNRQLAQAIGRDLGDIGKALSLARLPLAVVQAFRSPLDLQYRWAKPLADAQQRDPEGLVARARALKSQVDKRTPKQIFEALADGAPVAARTTPADIGIRLAGRQVAVVSSDPSGHTVVRFAKALPQDQRRALADAVEQFLAGPGRAG